MREMARLFLVLATQVINLFWQAVSLILRPFVSRICAHCRAPAQGRYAIHRDGLGEGPEVPLCDACGRNPTPTCEQIWANLARQRG